MSNRLNYGELTEIYLCLHTEWKRERRAYVSALKSGDHNAQMYSSARLTRIYGAMTKTLNTIERKYE